MKDENPKSGEERGERDKEKEEEIKGGREEEGKTNDSKPKKAKGKIDASICLLFPAHTKFIQNIIFQTHTRNMFPRAISSMHFFFIIIFF